MTPSGNGADIRRVRAIDSHTGGEPTRVIVDGFPDLGTGPLSGRLDRFRSEFDSFRSAVVNEPRGSEVMVGALLLEPSNRACAAGVIFFNNVGFLGMCGHGTIGLVKTLAYLGRLSPGERQIETPVGIVTTILHPTGGVSVRNVPSYRLAKDVQVRVDGAGDIVGDVAWGGNWFFLVANHGQDLSMGRVATLTEFAWHIRQALARDGITGRDGQEIDHIESSAPSPNDRAHSRNFVLCPVLAYDRSPCGTGTSAKLACLFADGEIREGEVWRQESITGSLFEGSISRHGDDLIPTIRGSAWVNAETTIVLDPADPLCYGMGAGRVA